ncbi:DUF6884 domain-containing protein [Streptomyces sp. NBC_01751]|uniref:DUF6884 domain-containing protein n=1 Tax=Streptomyces sp. NBC_01751 TaxID=2975929 RepID=UPI002DDBB0FD|nr:DUF6884 domain-containing protein [Streptomyces sp. NBC_01751]WSD24558.1 hypothetical protein OHA26_14285 [Streptomyces sp. NBC_01751]
MSNTANTTTLPIPGQIRRHVLKNLTPRTKGERDLKAACVAGAKELEANEMSSLNTIDLHVTNDALGVALDLARDWLDSDNGNNVMAGKSMLKYELSYEPADPRELRHEIKMPKSLIGFFMGEYNYEPAKHKRESKIVRADLERMSWTGTGAKGRVRAETLGWFLGKMDGLKEHPHPAVQRAAKKFIDTFTEPYEQTQRLITGYLGIEDEEPEKEIVTAEDFKAAIHGPGPELVEDEPAAVEEQRPNLVVIACGGKKSDAPGKIPAEERYTGNYFRACLMAAEVMDGPTMILSAKFGLIPLSEEIENYDMRMGDKDSVRLGTVRRQVEALGLENAKVTVLGGEHYVKAARQLWPDAEAPLTGGIGQQLKQLADIYGGEPEQEEHQDQEPEEPARRWEKRRLSHLVSWGDERRFFYFGGLAKHAVNEAGPLVGLKWSESNSGSNYLKDPETGRVIAEVHSMSNVWAIPAEAPEGFVEYADRGKPADELYWPEEYSRGEFRNIPNLPSRGRNHEPVIWYGGKAGVNVLKPKGWQKVKVVYTGEGKYDLVDFKTGESVKTCTLANQVFWATVNEDQDQAPEVEVKDPLLNLLAETAPPKGGYEVPENWIELAEEGNTEAARRYWTRRCEEYRRTGK